MPKSMRPPSVSPLILTNVDFKILDLPLPVVVKIYAISESHDISLTGMRKKLGQNYTAEIEDLMARMSI